MSQELTPIENIKIPYPSEGIIRTAQLDDTVAPENSVQLAVNMTFDQIGAIQTRLGVTEYAPTLTDPILNYGTLRNAITPQGGDRLVQLASTQDIADPDFSDPALVKISDTKVMMFWSGLDNDGFCRLYELDAVTGSLTPIGTVLEFDTVQATEISAIQIDDSRVLAVWAGSGNDGFVQVFSTTGDTPTALGTALEFDTGNGRAASLALIDATHVICFYTSSASAGVATVFAIDGSGTVTEPGTSLTFDATDNYSNNCAAIGNGTHFVNFWQRTGAGLAQAFSVNTSTWAITAIGTALNYEASMDNPSMVPVGDGEYFVNVFSGTDLSAQTFRVNPSTYAVTEVGTPATLTTSGINGQKLVSLGDGEHFVSFYCKNLGDGYAQLLAMNPSTFNMSVVGNPLSGYDFSNQGIASIYLTGTTVLTVWALEDELGGKSAFFKGLGDVVFGRWLYAGVGSEIYNLESGTWTSRRSGLAQVSKPRFSQYLNYVWMVNGNAAIGGDPVATSNGGAFGTDLVPANFPQGDFIHAGFEGRVWVADKQIGAIYYTDIVQFTPPDVYTLTYDPSVNFITNLAPQNGQQFTALYRVPRALLVFTEDNIYRIYGATSVDAYPAYNVGTYSQESIVETKTGIFFHHSSGFYQFDYGSQPVEISRRVIDFVKAIPRSYYENITGVYDGFDAVEWSVGEVLVEGVVFSNCVMRYTISTQVWTIYDYKNNVITAMIQYDNGTTLSHLMGTSAGKTGAMDTGVSDFGQPFYYDYISRWISFTELNCMIKNASGFNVYSENAAGANLYYQTKKSGPNAWKSIMKIDERTNSLQQNSSTDDFDVMRLRIAGNTSGQQVVIHGIEITQLTIKGFDTN